MSRRPRLVERMSRRRLRRLAGAVILAAILPAAALPLRAADTAEGAAPVTAPLPPPKPPAPKVRRPHPRPQAESVAPIPPPPGLAEPEAPAAEAAPPAAAAEPPPPDDGRPHWESFDRLVPYDRALAEGVLMPMFGDNPDLWPDWLRPRAVLLPAGGGDLLVVREPLRAPCGDYAFAVFSPYQPPDGQRRPLGEPLCADGLAVQPMPRQAVPDLVLKGATRPDGDPNGPGFRHGDIRLRWNGGAWLELPAGKPGASPSSSR